jgi:hypothetical protein
LQNRQRFIEIIVNEIVLQKRLIGLQVISPLSHSIPISFDLANDYFDQGLSHVMRKFCTSTTVAKCKSYNILPHDNFTNQKVLKAYRMYLTMEALYSHASSSTQE